MATWWIPTVQLVGGDFLVGVTVCGVATFRRSDFPGWFLGGTSDVCAALRSRFEVPYRERYVDATAIRPSRIHSSSTDTRAQLPGCVDPIGIRDLAVRPAAGRGPHQPHVRDHTPVRT